MELFLIPIVLVLILLPIGIAAAALAIHDDNQYEKRLQAKEAQEKQAALKARAARMQVINARQRDYFFANLRSPMPILESDYEADENATRDLGDTWLEAINKLDFEEG